MRRSCRIAVAAITALALWLGGQGALAQKSGGILKMPDFASPASMSIHEEVTRAAVTVLMPVFNNLVLFDQRKERNTIDTIVPDLAESWAWSEDGKELTFKLRHGVKWHDGKPFTAADVKCTWDLLQGKTQDKLRLNPRKAWYRNLDEVTPKGDDEVTFHLKRPQPYLLVLLASGISPVYPCHVSPAQMRQHPIGTGPFKFVEYKPNEYVKLTRSPDYWKPGRPYLDGLEFPIVPSIATQPDVYRRQRRHDLVVWRLDAAIARHPEPGIRRDLHVRNRRRERLNPTSTGLSAAGSEPTRRFNSRRLHRLGRSWLGGDGAKLS